MTIEKQKKFCEMTEEFITSYEDFKTAVRTMRAVYNGIEKPTAEECEMQKALRGWDAVFSLAGSSERAQWMIDNAEIVFHPDARKEFIESPLMTPLFRRLAVLAELGL